MLQAPQQQQQAQQQMQTMNMGYGPGQAWPSGSYYQAPPPVSVDNLGYPSKV